MRRPDRASFFTVALLSTAFIGLSAPLALTGCGDTVTCDNCGDPGSTGSAAGSGGAGSTSGTGTSDGSTSGSTSGSGGGNTGDWTTLITGDWKLGAGSELTSDVHTKVVDHDIYVGAIRPIAPQGTHHTVLALDNLGFNNIIYASGVGTNPIIFPEGVGLKIPAGHEVVLQLHVFNPSGDPLSGTSGIEIIEVSPTALKQEASIFLPGPLGFNIPANQKYTATGDCTVDQTQTLFALFPHMHQLGTHFKTTVTTGGEAKVIHDDVYSFYNQAFIPIDPITVNPGDTIKTECTWDNTLPMNVTWGESSNAEMCFSILYRYPALGGGGFCQK